MRYVSNHQLQGLLDKIDSEERTLLMTFLDLPIYQLASSNLVKRIVRASSHSGLSLFKGDEPRGYLEILISTCRSIGMNFNSDQVQALRLFDDLGRDVHILASTPASHGVEMAVRNAEQGLIEKLADKLQGSLSGAVRENFEELLEDLKQEQAKSNGRIAAVALGTLTVGNLGGFGTYTAMSTLLHAVSFGTLGFGAYTTASSLLSVALGPVGWASMLGVLAYRFGKADMASTLGLVLMVSLMRLRHNANGNYDAV